MTSIKGNKYAQIVYFMVLMYFIAIFAVMFLENSLFKKVVILSFAVVIYLLYGIYENIRDDKYNI